MKRKDRFDNDDNGELDDVAIFNVDLFRLERMNNGCFWMRLYKKTGEIDHVFWFNAKGKLTVTHEEDDK